MRKNSVFIFSVIFVLHLTKCSTEVKENNNYSVNNLLHELEDDEEYKNYNIVEKVFGRKGILMNLLFHRRDLEYREALAAHYVKYHENKENTKAYYIDLVKTMVGKDYKKEDIIDILDKIKET